MYQLEEFKNKTDIKNYLENYVDVPVFLEYCKECRHYGRIWSCPPYDFEPEEYWKKYQYIHLIGTKLIFDRGEAGEGKTKEETEKYARKEFFRIKTLLSEKMHELEKKYPGSVALSAGNCNICKRCTRPEGNACLHPDRLRYSIESLGGNVEKTAGELLGIQLQWMDGKLPEYLTLVNGFLTNDPDVEI
jgi:predicted metal-binding protein